MKGSGPVRQQTGAGLASILAGVVLCTRTDPFWWFGVGFLLGGAALLAVTWQDALERLRARLDEPRMLWGRAWVPSKVLADVLCLAVLAFVARSMMPEVLTGDRPIGHDHTVHFFKSWQLGEHLLPAGRLHGWSHRYFAGYPVAYHYPMGAYLWVAGVKALGVGMLSWGEAYGVAFWLQYVLGAWAVYVYARQGMSRWAALLGGLLYLTDQGGLRTGGWRWTAYWGVWPQFLAMSLAVLAAARLPRVMEGQRYRDIGWFGILFGVSIWTHPFVLFHFAALLPIALLAFWVADRDRPWLVGALRLGAGYLVGVLVCLLWLFPYLANKDYSAPGKLSPQWGDLYQLGQSLYDLKLFSGTWGLVTALGLVGCIGLLRGRRFHSVFTGLIALTLVLAGSSTFAAEFHLYEAVDMMKRVHLMRFPILLKPYWFAAAGYAVVLVVTATGRREDTGGQQRPSGAFGRAFVFGLVAVPLLVPFGFTWYQNQVDRELLRQSERPFAEARTRLVKWFENHPAGPGEFFRVAVSLGGENVHSLLDLGVDIDRPIYNIGSQPASLYAYQVNSPLSQAFEAANVRYFVADRKRDRSDLELVKRFGNLRLYEFLGWSPDPFVVTGTGQVTLERFEDDEIVLRAAPGASGRLRLNVSAYPNWRATRDDQPIDIDVVQVRGVENSGFMEVDLAPGTYRFVFGWRWVDWVAWLACLLGLLGGAVLVAADVGPGRRIGDRWTALDARLVAWLEAHRTATGVGGVVAFLLLVGIALAPAMWHPPISNGHEPYPVARVHYDLADNLGRAKVSFNGERCTRVADEFVCRDLGRVAVRTRDFGGQDMYRCIGLESKGKGLIEVKYPKVPAGEALVGFYGTSGGRHPTDLRIWVAGTEVFQSTVGAGRARPLQVPLDRTEPFELVFKAETAGPHALCINAQVADLEPAAYP